MYFNSPRFFTFLRTHIKIYGWNYSLKKLKEEKGWKIQCKITSFEQNLKFYSIKALNGMNRLYDTI